jgi:ParB/RepB/Spo0J family partition protein
MATSTKPRSNTKPIRATGSVSLVDAPMTTAGTTSTHEFVPALDLDLVDPNPYNIRERAIADDELIESIRSSGLVEPLVVVPNPEYVEGQQPPKGKAPAKYRLAAGHRRVDALLRIGAPTAPAIIRYDLDTPAKQVEAMLIENGRRQDLSPIEEAKGYHQLELFGISATAIAKAVGRDRKTVSARLKLLDLSDTVQQRVSDGQVTIDDAIAIAALPTSEQSKVAKSAGTWSFKQELAAAERRTKKQAEVDAKIKELKAAGVPERTLPAGKTMWSISDAADGMTRLGATFSNMLEDHDGCLAWVKVTGPDIDYVCTNIAAHDEQLSEKQRQDREDDDRAAAAAKERREAQELASRLRADALFESIKPGLKLDPAVEGILHLLVRISIYELHYFTGRYQDVLELPADERWERYPSQWKQADVDKVEAHLAAAKSPADLLKLLAAVLVTRVEESYLSYLGGRGPQSPHNEQSQATAKAFMELVAAAGHVFTPVELEDLNPAVDEDEADES